MNKFLEDLDLDALKAMVPAVIVSALLAALLVLGVLKVSGNLRTTSSTVTVAVFDVVKFANAQRALASQFIGKRDEANEAGTLLLTLSKKTAAAIDKVAGPGVLVLVKQGVVSGDQLDITDAVLTELGLPTDVPTVEPMKYLQDVAPTMLMLPRREAGPAVQAPEKADANSKVLP